MGFFNLLTAGAAGGIPIPLILDLAVVIVFLIFAFIGAKKGFLKGIVGMVGTILAIIITYQFAEPFTQFMEEQFGLTTTISSWLESFLNQNELFRVELSDEGISKALESLGLPEFLSSMVMDVIAQTEITGAPTISQAVAPALGGIISSTVCGGVLLFGSSLLLKLVSALLSGIFDKIPVLGGINRFLGFVLGCVKALVLIYIVLGILSVLPITELHTLLNQTTIIAWLYQTNLLILLIQQISSIGFIVEHVQNFIAGLTETATAMI